MYTEEEKELVLDRIDKMTLKEKRFTEAFLMINAIEDPFFPEEVEEWKNKLKALVKLNASKHGVIYEGLLNEAK